MTIQERLRRSNLVMLVVPVVIAGVLFAAGLGALALLLNAVYLPRLGLTFQDLHSMGEEMEQVFRGLKLFVVLYAAVVLAALLAAVAFTNLYLTRALFAHIQKPLDILLQGVQRIQNGDPETPICYQEADEFRPACDAVDAMAVQLRDSLQQQREQQKKQELIAGMSHDLKSPLTTIRAYTEALLEGVAPDEAARHLRLLHPAHRGGVPAHHSGGAQPSAVPACGLSGAVCVGPGRADGHCRFHPRHPRGFAAFPQCHGLAHSGPDAGVSLRHRERPRQPGHPASGAAPCHLPAPDFPAGCHPAAGAGRDEKGHGEDRRETLRFFRLFSIKTFLLTGSGLALSVIACAMPPCSPFCRLRDIFPRRGGSLSKGEALAVPAKFLVSPEALPLGELSSERETERARPLKIKAFAAVLLIRKNQRMHCKCFFCF